MIDSMKDAELQSAIEALLFVSGEAVGAETLSKATEASRESVEEALLALQDRYRVEGSGLMLAMHEGMVEIVTRPEVASLLEKFATASMQGGLSKAALEVLSVIAYRGPVSRADIEAIRGVNCQFSLRNLLLRGLIERQDDEESRGYVYTVSMDFLKHLGLEKIEDLPQYEALSQDERLKVVVDNEESKESTEEEKVLAN